MPKPWKYEPDEDPKVKHRWSEPRAGFVERSNVPVGKCPSTLTSQIAEKLVNEGIPWDNPRLPTLD